jgi:redox-sensitive bicupin YhaK (pirin superfamily)
MKSIFHPANSRGDVNHGWLHAKHSFSFGSWYNPERVHFGALRVLNDDIVAAGMGFGTHPHDNMEIITIPLSGAIAHKDSMGNASTINAGEIQVMNSIQSTKN